MIWLILIAAVAGFNVLALKFAGPPSHMLASMGYYDCASRAGKCGGSIPGEGYPCTNPGAVCKQGAGGNENLHCVTKANWFWGCVCDCSC